MRPKGLTQLEIERICQFDWDNSEDENDGGMEEENNSLETLESFIEYTIQNCILKGETIEHELLKEFNGERNEDELSDKTVQTIFEKVKLDTLRWRKKEFDEKEANNSWKSCVNGSITKEPITYFSMYFDEEILQKICSETRNLYAFQKDGVELKCNVTEIKRFMGVLLYLGVVKIPVWRMAWSSKFRLPAVADSMPRKRFEKIKRYFHFNNNLHQPQKGAENYDKLYKIRPLLAKMKNICNSLEKEDFLSVDEQMIPFKGKHNLKQYLLKKPHKWGFKMFSMAGVTGLVHDFCLYVGGGTCDTFGLGISSDIVLHLTSHIPENQNFKIFLDNWFTSVSLMIALKEKGILAVGTIRNNRLINCLFKSEKNLAKEGRGSYDLKVETSHKLVACRWFDNKSVTLISNYIADQPVTQCTRWCRNEKKNIQITRPAIVESYNKHMGGVDLSDMLLELYRINHRTNKWYTRIVFWCMNLAVVNSWILYRRDLKCSINNKKHIALINFQLDIANELLQSNIEIPSRKRGRSAQLTFNFDSLDSSPSSSAPNSPPVSESSTPKRIFTLDPVNAIRYDKMEHWIQWGSKGRCRLCKTGFPCSKCSKCQVYLCSNPQKNCFVSYHT